MPFNELNSTEYFIIQQLTGVNLNTGEVQEPAAQYTGVSWRYKSAKDLNRTVTDVLVERELRTSLIRINPAIAERPERADEVIHRLRFILLAVNNVGLVRANEEFAKWLRGEVTMPFGPNGEHVPVLLIDFTTLNRNTYICTNQYMVRARETKEPDIALLINGIPVVIGEAKTPVRPAVSWRV